MTIVEIILLSSSWSIYFFIHSWLANESFKQKIILRFNLSTQKYRLVYVTLAVLLLLPPVWFTFQYDSVPLWKWNGILSWIMNSLAAIGVAGFILSMKYYDGMAFLGLKPFATETTEQPFTITPFCSPPLVLLFTVDYLDKRYDRRMVRNLSAYYAIFYYRHKTGGAKTGFIFWRYLSNVSKKSTRAFPITLALLEERRDSNTQQLVIPAHTDVTSC